MDRKPKFKRKEKGKAGGKKKGGTGGDSVKDIGKTLPFYRVLGIDREATKVQVRRAYLRLALQLHPDKVAWASSTERESAHEAFTAVGKAYEVLADPERRSVYDRSNGCEDEISSSVFDFVSNRVTVQDINVMQESYPGSSDELEDLRSFITLKKGDCALLFEYIPFSQPDCFQRLQKVVIDNFNDEWPETIERSLSQLKKKLPQWRKRLASEATEVEDMGGLEAILRARQKQRSIELGRLCQKFETEEDGL